MFRGNYDIYHTVAQKILPAIKARYIRIHPKGWRSYIAMRVELYGGRLRGDYMTNIMGLMFKYLVHQELSIQYFIYFVYRKLLRCASRSSIRSYKKQPNHSLLSVE